MGKKDTYKLCSLKRLGASHMAYIPSKFASVGKVVKIKKDDTTWEDGWEVVGVAPGVKTREEANTERSRNDSFGTSIK